MQYVSTRGAAPKLGFEEAMLAGLARDGGLYVPETWPRMTEAEIAALAGLSYEEAAFRVMRPFIGDAFGEAELRGIIARAYAGFDHAARVPLVQTGPNDWLLELFHGPTLAFKDVAMQLIGQLFEASLTRSGRRLTIVGATSGDTGSAAIEAFRGKRGGRGLHPLPRRPGVGGAAPADDDAGRGQRACAGDRRRLRRRAGAAEGSLQRPRLPRRGRARRGQLDQLGAGAGADGLLLHRRRGARRAARGRSASRCRPGTSATSSRAMSRSGWACRSSGW